LTAPLIHNSGAVFFFRRISRIAPYGSLEREMESMRKLICFALLIAGLAATVSAQDGPRAIPRPAPPVSNTPNAATADLPRFDLVFEGGGPFQLVEALNKRLQGALNVIIPEDSSDVEIPPMKMQDVNVAQVFQALQRASMKSVQFRAGNSIQEWQTSFDFTTSGPPTPNSVWSFHVSRPPNRTELPSYRFYQLAPYLDGLKIEDITTAIKTALKMLGEEPGPNLKFHAETKLLIAVGKESEFKLIDDVLKELSKGAVKPNRLSEVLVNGEVNKPGNIPLPKDQQLTVLDVVGRAGGLSSVADRNKIKVSHPGQPERIFSFDELKRDNSVYVEPGDVIDVPKRL
jgi:hypothetical protein